MSHHNQSNAELLHIFRDAFEFALQRYMSDTELLAIANSPVASFELLETVLKKRGFQWLIIDDEAVAVRCGKLFLFGDDLLDCLSKGKWKP